MKKFIFTAGSYDMKNIYYIEANNKLDALNKLKTYHENTMIFTSTCQFTIGESGLSDWDINEITEEIVLIN